MKSVEQIMKEVFARPTAPFREAWVLGHIEKELKKLRVPFFYDPWGNLICGVKTPKRLKKSQRIGLIAHTDHPGFHIEKVLNSHTYEARWLGGVPPKTLKATVALYHPQFPGKTSRGKIISKIEKGFFKIRCENASFPVDRNCFGAFELRRLQKKRLSRLYSGCRRPIGSRDYSCDLS